jgi:hypothetical protein
MIRLLLRIILCCAPLGAPAFAQNPRPATPLPAPPISEEAGPRAFLRAAAHAVVAGHLGEAQEALEMAQTRLLDRSVPLGTTGIPSEQPAVQLITQARQALAAGDRGTCLKFIEDARAALGPGPRP